MRRVVLTCAFLLLAACGGEPPPPDVPTLLAEGEAAFARGDELAAAAAAAADLDAALDGHAEAVAAWATAAQRYRDVFRLTDPATAPPARRALLAFRIGRAFAKAARHGRDPRWADMRADHAFLWFDQAARLAPDMRQLDYERARLFDSEIERARDLLAARAAYLRYLAAVDAADAVPEAEQARVAHARARAAALAPPPPPADD